MASRNMHVTALAVYNMGRVLMTRRSSYFPRIFAKLIQLQMQWQLFFQFFLSDVYGTSAMFS